MFEIKKLSNQAQLILAPRKETNTVTLLVLFKVGSRFEDKNNNGVSHFIEHLYFKGTKKRPNTNIISQDLDRVGAQYNAFTGKDYTGYFIKVAKNNIELAFDVLADMLWHSKFDAKEINRERGVIIEEIRMYKDNPAMHIGELLEELVFKGHTLARGVAGPETVIKNINRADILKYKNEHYRSNNMLVAVGGNYSMVKLNQLIKKYFSKKVGNKQEYLITPYISKQNQPQLKLQYKKTAQAQLALGFPALGSQSKNYITQLILATILGGNMSSRLFINIRERHGLAYSVQASIDEHADASMFYIQAGLKKDKIGLAYQLIIKELKNIQSTLIGKDELKKAKEHIKGKMLINLENSFSYIFWLSQQLMDDEQIKTIKQFHSLVDKVTPEQIQALAKEIFAQDKLNLAIIGPYKDSLYFNKLIKQYKI